MTSPSVRGLCVSVALSIAVATVAGLPVSADEPDPPLIADPSALVDAVAGRAQPAEPSPTGASLDSGTGTSEVATDPDVGMTLTSREGASVSVSVSAASNDGELDGGNIVYSGAGEDADVVARPTDAGAQAVIVIHGADAPSRYTFPVKVDDAPARLRPRTDGGVDVHTRLVDVPAAAVVAPAWAVDADGAPVPTHYEVEGDQLIQVVDHEGAAYPVVADPKVSFGWSIYLRYSKREVKDYKARGVISGIASVIAVSCGKLPNTITKAICAASVTVAAGAIINTFSRAAAENKCVELKFSYVGDLDGWKRYRC